jgi:hypothetical protein
LTSAFVLFHSRSVDPGDSAASDASAGASGLGGIGSAPRGSVAPPPGNRPVSGSSATPGSGPSAPSVPAASPLPPSSSASAVSDALSATYREPGILGGTYQVSITNKGAVAVKGWTVAILLSGMNVVVKPGAGVTHEVRPAGGQHVFTPMAVLETVPAHGSVGFTFTVQALLPKIQMCTIDEQPCTSDA